MDETYKDHAGLLDDECGSFPYDWLRLHLSALQHFNPILPLSLFCLGPPSPLRAAKQLVVISRDNNYNNHQKIKR